MARLTEDDPYRLERSKSVFAGGDFRYFYLDTDRTATGSADYNLSTMLAMAFDLGVKIRPVPEKVSLVFEHRYYQRPVSDDVDTQTSPEKVFSTSQVRSAYAMVDDLPYATYVMYGLYRPQFAHYTADHTSLLNTLLYADNRTAGGDSYNANHAKSSYAVHKALTIGGSPNVPFANLHMIMPTDFRLANNPFTRDSGWALSLGGRFVTFGASAMLSWWSTEGTRVDGGDVLKNDMVSLSGGATYKKIIANFDYTMIDREFAPGSSDTGAVATLEVKYRVWREIYALMNYAQSNTARNLKKGSATDMNFGAKSFLYPGTEFEVLLVNRKSDDDTNNLSTTITGLQAQLHLYF
jgi:hypothetical protein